MIKPSTLAIVLIVLLVVFMGAVIAAAVRNYRYGPSQTLSPFKNRLLIYLSMAMAFIEIWSAYTAHTWQSRAFNLACVFVLIAVAVTAGRRLLQPAQHGGAADANSRRG